jgi:L-threonylcarbamoyladenylate synthase
VSCDTDVDCIRFFGSSGISRSGALSFLRTYSSSRPDPTAGKRPDWYYDRPPPYILPSTHLPGFAASPPRKEITQPSPQQSPKPAYKPPKSSVPKRPSRPLSFVQLVQRQQDEQKRQQDLQRAKQEYESQLQTGFISAQPTPRPQTAFRPALGTRRYLKALYLHKYGSDGRAYLFPEDLPPIGGLKKKKKIYFKTAHRFLSTRFRLLRDKFLLESEKVSKQWSTYAKRTAFTIVKKRTMEDQQVKFDEKVVLEWKEGDQTFILPITTGDIVKNTATKVMFKRFSPSRLSIKLASRLLHADSVVAFPTETVYGLGANALSTEAVEKIYKAKNRPADNPLITHFGSLEQLETFTTIPEVYRPLVEKFWPGPLTILVPVTTEMGISPLVTAGLDTLAVRIPQSPLARGLLLESGIPIAAPSANASTRPSPTLAEHVNTDLNTRIPLILSADEDAGSQCDVGLESTVVDGLSDPPTILRLGGISPEAIRSLGGVWMNTTIYQKPAPVMLVATNGDVAEEEFKPRTPGMKYRHYSPRCPVYLYPFNSPQPERPSQHLLPSANVDRKVAVLCTRNWEPKEDPEAELEFNWMGDGNEDIARNLFKCVRDMDEWGAEAIIVEGVEEIGLGRSIMERLRKMSGGVIGEKN